MRRRLQFGMRENPASDRRHGSRQAICGLSDANRIEEENVTSTPLTAAHADTRSAPNAALPRAATGEEETSLESRRRRPNYIEKESLPAPLMNGKGLVGIHEAAQFLAVSVSTLYGWVWQRRISFIKVGRAVRFDLSDLNAFVEENRIHAKPARKL